VVGGWYKRKGIRMNERIKQLAEQAGITDNNLSDGNMSHTDLKKFAELIVAECAGVALNTGCGDIEDELLKHFGVKE
jgi:hypothetical protein